MTGKSFGEQAPSQGETAVSWQTWSDGAGGTPSISGDADWGKLALAMTGAEGRSAVYDLGEGSHRITLTSRRYGSGMGTAYLQVRGSAASFNQDDATPLWETYSASILRPWRYVQVRESTLYETTAISLFGTAIVSYLPMGEASGTALADVSGNSRGAVTGGATGPTLGVAGIGDSKTAVSFPASNAFVNWYSAGLAGAFSGAEGSLIAWCKVSAAGVWSDGVSRYIARLRADDNNDIRLLRSSSNNNMILVQHIAGGTSRPLYVAGNSTGWLMVGITWSATGGTVQAWVNGAEYGANLGAPGSWTGNLAATTSTIGAGDTSSTGVWSGSLAHVLLLNRAATAAEMLALYHAAANPITLTVIGDSISTEGTNQLKYTSWVRDGHNGGRIAIRNYSAGGATILHTDGYLDMDDETASAVSDDARIIIIELGTNGADDAGIEAEYLENLQELQGSNPNAVIYAMGILPRADPGDNQRDEKNARIESACASAGVTYWNTDGWIDPATDCSDGLHPTVAGHVKIAAQVLARLA